MLRTRVVREGEDQERRSLERWTNTRGHLEIRQEQFEIDDVYRKRGILRDVCCVYVCTRVPACAGVKGNHECF